MKPKDKPNLVLLVEGTYRIRLGAEPGSQSRLWKYFFPTVLLVARELWKYFSS